MSTDPQLTGTAPYRFVPLNVRVVRTEHADRLDRLHDTPLPGGLSATLDVEWAAETPFLIGEESETDPDEFGPMKLGDDYVIPGASLRGMLRAVMEPACFARLCQINEDHRFALRDFDHPHYKSSLLQQSEIKAGWIRRQGETWWLRPCEWRPITIDSLLNYTAGCSRDQWLVMDRRAKYRHLRNPAGECPVADGDAFIVDWERARLPVRPGERNRWEVGGDGERRYIVPSGRSVSATGKFARKVEYAFTAGNEADDVRIDQAAWNRFLVVHCRRTRSRLEPQGAWLEWQHHATRDDHWIPVFYIGTPRHDDFAMGLTRLFRLPARHSVGEIRDRVPEHALRGDAIPDMVEALFGFVHEDDAYSDVPQQRSLRSRIRFGFARLISHDDPPVTPAMDVVMMGPRPSFAPFYLLREADWSGLNKALLAGRKRYPVRFASGDPGALDDIRARFRRSTMDAKGRPISDGTRSSLRFLHGNGKDLVFRGQIRLHNVSPVELGAVIWALKLGELGTKKRRHALGRGKAFGCGQMRVRSIGLRVRPHRQGDESLAPLLQPPQSADRSAETEHWVPEPHGIGRDWNSLIPFQNAFVRHMTGEVPDWGKTATIQGLLATCNPDRGAQLRRQDKLNYLGELGNDRKVQDGHTAHSRLKKDAGPGVAVRLPWT